MKKVSLSIVTYNNEKVIGQCLETLLAASTIPAIVDNHSGDATVQILESYLKQYPVKLILNQVNYGFGYGHNLIIATVSSDYHIICNPDILINPDAIPLLAQYMDEHPDIGILCPKLTNPDGSLQANNHRYPTVLDLALRRLAPAWLKTLLKKRMDAYLMLDVGYGQICDVPFVSGAFMFCRTSVLKQVGGFDERYFLYFEDVDLCRKVQEAGYLTVYFPDAQVIHQWERAAYKSWRMSWVMLLSAVKYFNKWGWRFA